MICVIETKCDGAVVISEFYITEYNTTKLLKEDCLTLQQAWWCIMYVIFIIFNLATIVRVTNIVLFEFLIVSS